MRLAVALALLAGCYRPAVEDACKVTCLTGVCPEGARCMAGRCVPNGGTCMRIDLDAAYDAEGDAGDAFVSPDAVADAPGTMTCTPTLGSQEATYRAGQSFTMNRAKNRAALLTFDTSTSAWVVSVGDGANVDATPPAFLEEIAPSGLIGDLGYPRLSPDGATIFMTGHDDSGAQFPLFSNRISTTGRWSSPQPLHLQDMNGVPKPATFGLVLGTPSETSPRRMPISYDTINLREFEEVAQDTWRERIDTTGASLGVILIREPNFTPDGLRVVFVGQKPSGNVGIYTSTRVAIGQPWNAATLLFDDMLSAEGSAYLAADCSALFYDNANAGVVKDVR